MRLISLKLFCLMFLALTLGACLDLEPDRAVNKLGEPHTLTLTAVDTDNHPIIDELIEFRIVDGPNQGRVSVPFSGECVPDNCRTDESGQVTWTYTSSLPGRDSIVAFGIFVIDETEEEFASDTVMKLWEVGTRPIPTLSLWPLILLAAAMGAAAYVILRKRKPAA